MGTKKITTIIIKPEYIEGNPTSYYNSIHLIKGYLYGLKDSGLIEDFNLDGNHVQVGSAIFEVKARKKNLGMLVDPSDIAERLRKKTFVGSVTYKTKL